MVDLRLFVEVFNSNLNILNVLCHFFPENNLALPEDIILIYSKMFLNRNFSFQENDKIKVNAFEDSLSLYLTGMRAICDYFETNLRHVLATIIRYCNHNYIAVTPNR